MRLGLDADQVLTTTRAVRKRLDLARPVEREVVEECARIAFQAPNGGNRQWWGWVFVDDADLRRALGDLYRAGYDDDGYEPDWSTPETTRLWTSALYFLEHIHEVPVLLVPTVEGRLEGMSLFDQAGRWGSVLPGVWSFMLALRERGMGSVWTCHHLKREREAVELLGIPYESVTQVGLFPVAYTIGTDFKPADRSSSRVRWNHW